METNNKHLFQLDLTKTQQDHLIQIFAGPELLVDLLKSEENTPKNYSEIGLFLLKNKTKIYPYICKNIHSNVDILSDVIYRLIQSKDQGVRLDFLGNCSLSKDYFFYFPIRGLGLISPADRDSIANWKKSLNGRRYIPAFSIIKLNKSFFVELELEPFDFNKTKINSCYSKQINTPPKKEKTIISGQKKEKQKKEKQKKEKQKKEKQKKLAITHSNLETSYSEKKISNALALAKFSFRQKPSDHQGSENYGSIWTVSGGLPSLGRHR